MHTHTHVWIVYKTGFKTWKRDFIFNQDRAKRWTYAIAPLSVENVIKLDVMWASAHKSQT